ncbi:helix-turn-helix domain-containing protein [Treponema sp.]|uniref:helix-turn-helix domain-containing protein n=1 Tax=Treponema sp. TaxID=166 RepID=UPI0039A30C63
MNAPASFFARRMYKQWMTKKDNEIAKKDAKILSEATGIAQSDISKIENGSANPTVKLLQRLAEGLNMSLKVEFVPKSSVVVR